MIATTATSTGAFYAAITNALRPIEVPYVFGGDGAFVCVLSNGTEGVRSVLAATGGGGYAEAARKMTT